MLLAGHILRSMRHLPLFGGVDKGATLVLTAGINSAAPLACSLFEGKRMAMSRFGL